MVAIKKKNLRVEVWEMSTAYNLFQIQHPQIKMLVYWALPQLASDIILYEHNQDLDPDHYWWLLTGI